MSERHFGNLKSLKNNKKCILLHLKSSFRFQDILSFCLDFFVMYKNGLIRKVRLVLKFITSKSGQQTIVMHIFPNISRSKGNQTMKLRQLIEYNLRSIFVKIIHKMYWRNHSQTFI